MSMHKLFLFGVALLCGTIATKAADDERRYELDVKDFSELRVIEGLSVDYKCSADSAGYVTFTSTPDLASVLMFTNNKNRLDIQISTDGIDYQNLPRITVYSRFLSMVENSGDSLVRVQSLQPVPAFKARVIGNGRLSVYGIDTNNLDASLDTGNGTITLYGKAVKTKYNLVGTGSIQADELVSDEIKCSLLGTGFIECAPVNMLNIVGASSGKVYYKGHPQIKTRSLGVKVISMDANTSTAGEQ